MALSQAGSRIPAGSIDVACAVLQYLMQQPTAQDSVDGIQQWWLAQEFRQRPRGDIEQAFDGLVAVGWLTVRPVRAGNRQYGLNPSATAEIELFLREWRNRRRRRALRPPPPPIVS